MRTFSAGKPQFRGVRGNDIARDLNSVVLVYGWPRRLSANLAAAYCGEPSTRAFLSRVGSGKEYPLPQVKEGRRALWLRDDLDKAITPDGDVAARDVARDL